MRTLGFRTAMIAAIGAHAIAALALARSHANGREATTRTLVPAEVMLLLDDAPLAASPAASPAAAPAPAREPERDEAAKLHSATRGTPLARASMLDDAPRAAADAPAAAEPATAPAASGWSLAPAAPVALGIGEVWKHVAAENGAAATPDGSTASASSHAADRILRDGADARDRALGLGRGGPLVSAARAAASSAMGPDVGSATLEVDADAAGTVLSARPIAASHDMRAWDDVARELVRLMTGKPLHVRAGGRGLRAHLRIVAERRAPSGNRGSSAPGALPDDVPGADPVCEGTGAERRCVAGLPLGFSTSTKDVANLAAPAARVVSVLLLDEETL